MPLVIAIDDPDAVPNVRAEVEAEVFATKIAVVALVAFMSGKLTKVIEFDAVIVVPLILKVWVRYSDPPPAPQAAPVVVKYPPAAVWTHSPEAKRETANLEVVVFVEEALSVNIVSHCLEEVPNSYVESTSGTIDLSCLKGAAPNCKSVPRT